MRLSIDHTSVYTYQEPVRRVVELLKMAPTSFPGQTVLDWRVDVDCDARVREGRDGYGNITHMLYVDQPIQRLAITVSGRVLTEDRAGIVSGVPCDLPPAVFLRPTELTSSGASLADLADRASGTGAALDRLHRLNQEIHRTMVFDPGSTSADTDAEQAFQAGHGVCQDFAHIFIAAARRLGFPARYISGHLFRRDGAAIQEAAHAWAEAWVDMLGWVAFDPTNGICTDDAYVRVACGLDYREASPIAGTRSGGGLEKLDVEVQVRGMRSPQAQAQEQN